MEQGKGCLLDKGAASSLERLHLMVSRRVMFAVRLRVNMFVTQRCIYADQTHAGAMVNAKVFDSFQSSMHVHSLTYLRKLLFLSLA